MSTINAGVVLVTQFVSSDSAAFSGYIDYINRSNAVRNDNIRIYTIATLDSEIQQYNEYMDYMANSKKTTELFTDNSDYLTSEEKEQLKNIFQNAQDNDSLMWQTVISFDNKWLADNGLLNLETGVLNEVKLKEYTRLSVNTLLDKEEMKNNSVWSAAIHYNTDNIHIHIATVQPIPQRELKTVKTIRFNSDWIKQNIDVNSFDELEKNIKVKAHSKKGGKYLPLLKKIDSCIVTELGHKCKLGDYIQLNSDGTIDISYYGNNEDIPYMAKLESEITTQKGKVKGSSIEAAKSRMVNKILSNNLVNEQINSLMRDSLITDLKNSDLTNNKNLKQLYYDIYQNMPTNKRLWQYNNNVITPVRTQIDKFITLWLRENHKDDWENLNTQLQAQQAIYQTAYGGANNNFADNNIKDLYSRLGNTVLKNLKTLSNQEFIDFSDIDLNNSPFRSEDIPDEQEAEAIEIETLSEEELEAFLKDFSDDLYLAYSEKYRRAKQLLYGTKEIPADQQAAFSLFEEESKNGNVYAIYDLATCYQKGLGCVANAIIAQSLFSKTQTGFKGELTKLENTVPKNEKEKQRLKNSINSLKYRIGKMNYFGQGIKEVDKKTAFKWFNNSSDYLYSKFYLAKFYENGEKDIVKKDSEKAFNYYKSVCVECEKTDKTMPYAFYKTAYMLENGLGVPADEKEAYKFYEKALKEFEHSVEERPDDFLFYRIGTLYLNGKGCTKNIPKAIDYLEQALEGGNDMAACTLAMTYIKNNADSEKIEKAYELLHNSADNNNNAIAQFNLGKLYLENTQTETEGVKYLTLSADQGNQFAQYKLGAYLFQNEKTKELGIAYLTDSAEQGNQFAQYKLGKYYLAETNETELAINYLTDSADQGNQFAQYMLGVHFLKTEQTEKGIKYLTLSAERGNEYAQYKLGAYLFDNGNKAEGMAYLIDAANQDNETAQYKLGSIYLENEETVTLGISYLSKCAEQGNKFACFKLGTLYAKTEHYNFKLSQHYLLQATEKGLDFAEYHLGLLYCSDKENLAHVLKGVEYLKNSADKGNQFSQYKLGKIYYYGNNFIKPDSQLADFYLEAAAEQGNSAAKQLLNRKQLRKSSNRINLRRLRLPYEFINNFSNLVDELGKDYRDHENIMNQIEYEKLQQRIEEERL